jgi:hypothetical protein
MYIQSFPDCCAIGVILHIEGSSLAAIRAQVQAVVAARREVAGGMAHEFSAYGAILATVTHRAKGTHKNLRLAGFIPIWTARNPKTENMVTLYSKVLTRSRRKKSR